MGMNGWNRTWTFTLFEQFLYSNIAADPNKPLRDPKGDKVQARRLGEGPDPGTEVRRIAHITGNRS